LDSRFRGNDGQEKSAAFSLEMRSGEKDQVRG
jgi:hypothetical protein